MAAMTHPATAAGDGVIRRLKIKAGCKQPEDNHEKRYQGKSVHIHHPFDVVLYLIGILRMNVNREYMSDRLPPQPVLDLDIPAR